jgi:hypothetical protein
MGDRRRKKGEKANVERPTLKRPTSEGCANFPCARENAPTCNIQPATCNWFHRFRFGCSSATLCSSSVVFCSDTVKTPAMLVPDERSLRGRRPLA